MRGDEAPAGGGGAAVAVGGGGYTDVVGDGL